MNAHPIIKNKNKKVHMYLPSAELSPPFMSLLVKFFYEKLWKNKKSWSKN